jgi:8-oxo-dGTP pyrophosphatase MutT (NUDIX family)
VDDGELLHEAAARELREEIGLVVNPDALGQPSSQHVRQVLARYKVPDRRTVAAAPLDGQQCGDGYQLGDDGLGPSRR